MTRDEIAEKLTVEISHKILKTIEAWLNSEDINQNYPDSALVASVLTGLVLTYESLAQSFNIGDHGYAFLHEFVMKTRNRKK
jgi:hypothetical protein